MDTLTVVFSRPVISLGSDFNGTAAQRKVPFRLTCPVPGKMRWVTTTIARFDPDISWPSDLDCTLIWNTQLTSWDGAKLQLGSIPARRRITSYSLYFSAGGITSETASNLTNGVWSADTGAPGDVLPEMPPDGRQYFFFSNPVNLRLIADALRLYAAVDDSGEGPDLPFRIRPCYSDAPWVAPPAGDSLDVNTTCADVEAGFGLDPDRWETRYRLSLPAGSRYHALSGPTRSAVYTSFGGLRRFSLPFMPSFDPTTYYGATVSYRRLDAWLVHGLAPGVPIQSLARRLSLCELSANDTLCTPVPFSLERTEAAKARMTVPSLRPGAKYMVNVTADPQVRDGFGLGLQASSAVFIASPVPYDFAPPSLAHPRLAVLEAGVDGLAAWPYVTRAPPPADAYSGWPANYSRNVSTFALDAFSPADVTKIFNTIEGNLPIRDPFAYLGAPSRFMPVPAELTTPGSGAGWAEVAMPLERADLQIAHACCDPFASAMWGSDTHILLRTSIAVSVFQAGARLLAWVTDASLRGAAGPVAAANVSFYAMLYDRPTPQFAGSCLTDASGVCSLELSPSLQGVSAPLGTLVTAPPAPGSGAPRLALLPSSGFLRSPYPPSPLLGKLVLDRLLVTPGDSVQVTGFVQRASPSGLTLPRTSWALLYLTSPWYPSDSRSTARQNYFVVLNGTAGTLHGEIPVPANASLASYSLALYVPPEGSPFGLQPNGALPPPPGVAPNQVPDEWQFATMVNFRVADPRPPTAELLVEAPSWALTNGTFTVSVTAVSYLGASVAGATMTLTWSTYVARGQQVLTTDAAGAASATIDLGALPPANRTFSGASLSVSVEWIGPTRERIFKSASVSLLDAPATLQLRRSLGTDTPGIAFAVAASLLSAADGSELTGVPVTVTLRPNDTAAAACGGGGGAAASCTVLSGGSFAGGAGSPPCRMALPCVGAFELSACAELPAELRVAGGPLRVCSPPAVVGRNSSEWALRPLSAHDQPVLFVDKPGGYLLGESPRLYLENPFAHARMMVVWGNDFGSRYLHVPALAPGALAEVTLPPLGPECRGGCSLVALLDVPRAAPADAPLGALPPREQLPVSAVFDPAAPHAHRLYGGLSVAPTPALDVAVEVAALGPAGGGAVRDAGGEEVVAIEPGATAQISVRVDGLPAASPAPAGGEAVEVTVYAVDAAFLDLLPYELPDVQQEMLLRLFASLDVRDMQALRLAPGAVRAVFDKLLARLTQLDPWLPVDTNVGRPDSLFPWAGEYSVDIPDDVYLSRYSSYLTYMPGYWGPSNSYWDRMPLAPSRAAPPPARAAPGMGGSPSSAETDSGMEGDVRSAADFRVTPLAAVASPGRDGVTRINFTAPQNLGTFVIRAFVAAGTSARYGSGESRVVVRRRLSLTASVPRFVRVNDSFEAGVLVTVGSAPASVNVTLRIRDPESSPLAARGALTRTVSFPAGGGLQQEVRFPLRAVGMGVANLTFFASDGVPGGGRDAMSLELAVEAPQGDVWVGTSFALAANGTTAVWQEGIELPEAVPGSGGLSLTAGVGNYPALAAMYDSLLERQDESDEPYAPPALLWATLPPLLGYYGLASTPAQAAAVRGGFADLAALTRGELGLVWTDPARWAYWYPDRADLYLNLQASFLVGLHAAAPPASLGRWANEWAFLNATLLPTWRAAAGRELLRTAAEAYAAGRSNYSDWDTLAWARLVLGPSWSPPNDPSINSFGRAVTDSLSLEALLGAASNRTVRAGMARQTRVVLSLLLYGMGLVPGGSNPLPTVVSATVTEVAGALRVQGRTAYVAAGPGSPSPAPLSEQALCLMLLLRAGTASLAPLMPKLAAGLAASLGGGDRGGGGGSWLYFPPAWNAQGLAAAALAEYDRSRGSSQPALDVLADANGLTVLRASFRSGSVRPVTNTTAWEDLPPPEDGQPGELNFQVSGRGEVSVAASLHLVPVALPSAPAYRGLYVESSLRLLDPASGQPAGPPVSAVPLGSLVVLSVQLSSPDALGAVRLEVMMPGGLEPLDPAISPGLPSGCAANWVAGGSAAWGRAFRGWWWPVCPAQETRPAVVTFAYAALRPGTSSVTITAVAASAGTFLLPPVRAYAEAQPELSGATAAGSVTVCDGCAGPTYAPPPAPPRGCPGDCSGNGACDVRSGVCACDEGYGGADCASPAVA